jgi:sugar phosphate isomerase/epimerase
LTTKCTNFLPVNATTLEKILLSSSEDKYILIWTVLRDFVNVGKGVINFERIIHGLYESGYKAI